MRGRKPVDMATLEQLMVRFSQLVVEQPWIKEIDINPLLASSERLLALDARVVLHGAEVTEDKLPRPAIRPYPTQYVESWLSKQGLDVTFRPIRPEDEPLVAKFHEGLSERTVFMRYLQAMNLNQRIAHERLSRLSYIDFDREIALVALTRNAYNSQQEVMGIGRVSKIHWTNEGEFAILVSDRYQHQGLGKEIMVRLVKIAKDEKLARIFGYVYNENHEMIRLVEKLGFTVQPTDRAEILLASLNL